MGLFPGQQGGQVVEVRAVFELLDAVGEFRRVSAPINSAVRAIKNSFSSAIVKLLRGCPLGPRSVSLKTRPSLQTTSTVVSGKVPCQKISNMCRRLA